MQPVLLTIAAVLTLALVAYEFHKLWTLKPLPEFTD